MSVLNPLRKAALCLWVWAATVSVSVPVAVAGSHHDDQSIMVHNAYARATFPQAQTGAVYLNVHNGSASPRRLMAVSVSEDIASEAQLHTTRMENDMMRMIQITDGLEVKPGATLSFQPGGYHIMLMGLKKGLNKGDTLTLTLIFANDDQLQVVAEIRAPGDDKAAHHHHHN